MIGPYRNSKLSKKNHVIKMFDQIATRYDFMNHLLSFGIDRKWRRKALEYLQDSKPMVILDVATGTGDLAIAAYETLHPERIVGIDISESMIEQARQKIKKHGFERNIIMQICDCETINFPNNSFDAIMVAFGIRNFQNLGNGLKEMFRVLRPNGKVIILEFSNPKKLPIKQLFNFYFKFVTPFIGQLITSNKEAYKYLYHSVQTFPEGEDMIGKINDVGFHSALYKSLTFGICSIYYASK